MMIRAWTALRRMRSGLSRLAPGLAALALLAGGAAAQDDVPAPPGGDTGQDQPRYETITFPSEDGLTITADLYEPESATYTILVVFHQAKSSRGEYRSIAPRLLEMGYRVLAVDLRSGDRFYGVENETARRAKEQGKPTNYLDAQQDMLAALRYADDDLRGARVVAWGSSYSASLAIYLASRHRDLIDGVVAFSPGDYFRGSIDLVAAASYVKQPTFITGARSETAQWMPIYAELTEEMDRRGLEPQGRGAHGSSALIPRRSDASQEYWQVLSAFLKKHF